MGGAELPLGEELIAGVDLCLWMANLNRGAFNQLNEILTFFFN